MKYDELVRTVAGRTALTRRAADDLIVATLTVLAENLTPDETHDLLAQLPKSLKQRVRATSQPLSMRPIEFVARVVDLQGGGDLAETETAVRAVFETLTEAVNAGEMDDVSAQLGDAYAEWLGREPEGGAPDRGGRDVVDLARETVERAQTTSRDSLDNAAEIGRDAVQRGSERVLLAGARGVDMAAVAARAAGATVSGAFRLARAATGLVYGTAGAVVRTVKGRSRDAVAVAADKLEDVTDVLDDAAEDLEARFPRHAGHGTAR